MIFQAHTYVNSGATWIQRGCGTASLHPLKTCSNTAYLNNGCKTNLDGSKTCCCKNVDRCNSGYEPPKPVPKPEPKPETETKTETKDSGTKIEKSENKTEAVRVSGAVSLKINFSIILLIFSFICVGFIGSLW